MADLEKAAVEVKRITELLLDIARLVKAVDVLVDLIGSDFEAEEDQIQAMAREMEDLVDSALVIMSQIVKELRSRG